MSSFFALLLLIVLGALIWSLIKPIRFNGRVMSRKKSMAVFGGLAFVLFFLIGITAPEQPKTASKSKARATQTPSIQPTSKPEPTVRRKTEAKKTNKSPKQVLEDICKKHKIGDNCIVTEENGKLMVATILESQIDFMMFSTAKQIARDFIFDIYATKLPIAHAAISINNYQTRKHYQAALGEDVARQEPQSTWTNKDVGPTIFYDFLKANTNGKPGDYKNSTYVVTNLD